MKLLVSPSGDFPATKENVIFVKPGHENFVSVKIQKISSESSALSLDPEERNCYMKSEYKYVIYFYSNKSNLTIISGWSPMQNIPMDDASLSVNWTWLPVGATWDVFRGISLPF